MHSVKQDNAYDEEGTTVKDYMYHEEITYTKCRPHAS